MRSIQSIVVDKLGASLEKEAISKELERRGNLQLDRILTLPRGSRVLSAGPRQDYVLDRTEAHRSGRIAANKKFDDIFPFAHLDGLEAAQRARVASGEAQLYDVRQSLGRRLGGSRIPGPKPPGELKRRALKLLEKIR